MFVRIVSRMAASPVGSFISTPVDTGTVSRVRLRCQRGLCSGPRWPSAPIESHILGENPWTEMTHAGYGLTGRMHGRLDRSGKGEVDGETRKETRAQTLFGRTDEGGLRNLVRIYPYSYSQIQYGFGRPRRRHIINRTSPRKAAQGEATSPDGSENRVSAEPQLPLTLGAS